MLDTVQQDYLMVLLGSNSSGTSSRAATNGHAGVLQQLTLINCRVQLLLPIDLHLPVS